MTDIKIRINIEKMTYRRIRCTPRILLIAQIAADTEYFMNEYFVIFNEVVTIEQLNYDNYYRRKSLPRITVMMISRLWW